MSTGDRICAFRMKKGLTQKQLGDLCGMADSAIRRYESDRGNPTLETIRRIATALEVSVIDLLPEADFVGEKIREARERAGMTQEDLGDRLGLSNQIVAQWENDLQPPKYETLLRIAAALNEDVSAFMPQNLAETYGKIDPIVTQITKHNRDLLGQDFDGKDFFYFYKYDENGKIISSSVNTVSKVSPITMETLCTVQEIRDALRTIETYCPFLDTQSIKKIADFVKTFVNDKLLQNQDCEEYLFSVWIKQVSAKIQAAASMEDSEKKWEDK